jgi:hypothetical protein
LNGVTLLNAIPHRRRKRSRAPLARRFRVWQKKRGDRRTGSSAAARAGEALLFASIWLIGFFALSALIASRAVDIPGLSVMVSGPRFWINLGVLTALSLAGAIGLARTWISSATSAERRRVLAKAAVPLSKKSSVFPQAHLFPSVPHNDSLYDSPGTTLNYRLPLAVQPMQQLVAQALYCLLWLAALAVGVVIAADALAHSRPWWLWLLACGLVCVVAGRATQRFLVQLREAIRIGASCLEISRLPLYPGQRCQLSYAQFGRPPASAALALVCDEYVEYREGTNKRSESRRVYTLPLSQWESTGNPPRESIQHPVEFVVPWGIMHSFQSNSNAIRWSFELRATSDRGTAFQRSFPVVVVPCPPQLIDRG